MINHVFHILFLFLSIMYLKLQVSPHQLNSSLSISGAPKLLIITFLEILHLVHYLSKDLQDLGKCYSTINSQLEKKGGSYIGILTQPAQKNH